MDLDFMQKVLPLYERAAHLTVTIGLLGVGLSLVVGTICAAVQYFKTPVLRQIAGIYTAKDLIGMYYKTTESLVLLVVFYMMILIPVSLVGMFVERRVRYAGFGT